MRKGKTGTSMTTHGIPKGKRKSRKQEVYKQMQRIWKDSATNTMINNDHMKNN